ncbi:Acidic endochitinase [Spatholobus suberectus]|nr:Acidic endochitinase [Spatholobus suberectus]
MVPPLLFILILLLLLGSSEAERIGIYWGQDGNEGSLNETCATGKYSSVYIAGMAAFGNGQVPQLNLAGHCDPSSTGCIGIKRDIRNCQRRGIKVMLSIGGGVTSTNFSLTSLEDAKNMSDYLWGNFLGGSSSSRPLGDAVLDGIDFDIVSGNTSFMGDLARHLKSMSVYLSTATDCPFRDTILGSALDAGLFDHVSVKFYNNPYYDYTQNNADNLLSAWNEWATSLKGAKIFLGLEADPAMVPGGGYIPADVLMSQIIPAINNSPNYGGVVLWSRYYDKLSGYSTDIQSFQINQTANPLCTLQSLPGCRSRDGGFVERVGNMSTVGIKVYDVDNNNTHCCEIICRNNCSCDAYAPINHINKTGCQIWGKGTKFVRASGDIALPFYVSVALLQEEHPVHVVKPKVNRWWIWLIVGVGAALAIPMIFYLCRALSRKYKAKVERKKMQEKILHDIGGNAMLSMVYGKTIKIRMEDNCTIVYTGFYFLDFEEITNAYYLAIIPASFSP